jgi:hypothetical protein
MKFGSLAARLSRSAAVGAIVSVIGIPVLAQQTSPPGQTVETTQPAEEPAESDGS